MNVEVELRTLFEFPTAAGMSGAGVVRKPVINGGDQRQKILALPANAPSAGRAQAACWQCHQPGAVAGLRSLAAAL
jgi:hypothetical protein